MLAKTMPPLFPDVIILLIVIIVNGSTNDALIEGRDFVKPDDIKAVAPSVLGHRLTLTSEARIAKEDKNDILQKLIYKTKLPL